MKKSMMLVAVVVMLVGSVDVMGDVYTTGTGTGSNTIAYAANLAGSFSNEQTGGTFTVDGAYRDDVWALVFSEIPGVGLALNGYGRSYDYGTEAIGFEFIMHGDNSGSRVQASLIAFILNDDDPDLFSVNESTGHITIGFGDDIVLWQESVSINGKPFGDISDIYFEDGNQPSDLDSVVLAIPEPATLCLLGFGGLSLMLRRRRQR
jgi:hypothetical protein